MSDFPSPDPRLHDVRVLDLFPGCWEDAAGGVHFSLPEVLAFCGIPDIPEEREENMALLTAALREKLGPDAQFILRATPPEHDAPLS